MEGRWQAHNGRSPRGLMPGGGQGQGISAQVSIKGVNIAGVGGEGAAEGGWGGC